MRVKVGQTVAMRNGDCIYVTGAADPGHPEGEYQWIDREDFLVGGVINVKDSMPAETIFMGYRVHPELLSDPNMGEPGYEPKTVVSDMSEVVSIIE